MKAAKTLATLSESKWMMSANAKTDWTVNVYRGDNIIKTMSFTIDFDCNDGGNKGVKPSAE